MQNDINNPYLLKSDEFFKTDIEQLLPFRLVSLMPFLVRPIHVILFNLGPILKLFIKWIPSLTSFLQELPAVWLINRVQDVIDLRTKSPPDLRKRIDLLQLMMDASTSDKVIVSTID